MIYDSQIWLQDINTGMKTVPELNQLENKNIMITGAAGLICSAIVDILISYNESHANKINILLAGRWLEEMEARFGSYLLKNYMKFVRYDASRTDNHIEEQADYIIHGASNAFPAMVMKQPVETMTANFSGMMELLEYAKQNGTKRILYISSSEVYGNKQNNEAFSEDQYGFIDLLNPRNSYSIGKRAAETLCASYAAEYGVESVIVRPGHIYGPTASPYDNRVSSAFAYSAARGQNIVMKSDGSQLRSYCYCVDCATAILKVLLCGENLNAYNISNPNSIITIKQMAQVLAKAGNVQLILEGASESEKKSFNPMNNSSLKSEKLESIGWQGIFNDTIGLTHTVKILAEVQNNNPSITTQNP